VKKKYSLILRDTVSFVAESFPDFVNMHYSTFNIKEGYEIASLFIASKCSTPLYVQAQQEMKTSVL
jgi:hypothetical protein